MSIVQVAEFAGVSPGTVSRVINGRNGISEKTVKQVRKAMERIGYVPRSPEDRPGPKAEGIGCNSLALRNVALVAVKLYKSQITSPVYAETIHGVEAGLAKEGLSMILSVLSDFDQIPKCLLHQQVNGVVLFGQASMPDKVVKILKQFVVVSVMGGHYPWCDAVSYDNSAVGGMAANYLIERGHRHLAYIGRKGSPAFDERALRFEMEAKKNAVNPCMLEDEQLLLLDDKTNSIDKNRLEGMVEKLIAMSPRPTGIFVAADMFVVPLYSLLSARGIKLGEDIEVVSVNNEKVILDSVTPRPATIDIQAYSLGYMAAERLLWRAEHSNEQRVTLLLDPKIVEGVGRRIR